MRMKKRRNRRRSESTMNVLTSRSFRAAGIIVALVVMSVINFVADQRCNQTIRAIREKEKLLSRLEQDRQRESAAWERMTAAENLERALIRHGLNMRYPKSEQVVRMDASGTPCYGQRSVALAKSRSAVSAPVASNTRKIRSRR